MEAHTETRENNYFLDSGGACFLCLKYLSEVKVEEEIMDTEDVKIFNKFSLLKMSRYFQIDIDKVYPDLFSSSKLDTQRNQVFVSLCDQCLIVYNLFDELYNKLEKTELLMKDCINTLHQVIQVDPIKQEEVQRGSYVDEKDAKIMDSYRKMIKFNCERSLKISSPKVLLSRLPDEEMRRWAVNQSNFESTLSFLVVTKTEPLDIDDLIASGDEFYPTMDMEWNEEPSWSDTDLMDDLPTDMEFPEEEMDPYPSPSPFPSETASTGSNKASVKTPELVKCPYCNFTCMKNWTRNMKLHLGSCHVEHFLPDLFKEFGMTFTKFEEFVNLEVKPFIKEDNCALCDKKYNFSNKVSQFLNVKTHLLDEHKEEVEKKLIEAYEARGAMEVESNSNIKEEEPSSTKTKISKSGRGIFNLECPYCSFTNTRPRRMHSHISTNHPEHYFSNVIETLQITPMKFRAMIDIAVKKFIKKDNCGLCKIKYHMKKEADQYRNVKIHLILKHRSHLEEKFLEIGTSPEFLSFQEEHIPPSYVRRTKTKKNVNVNDPVEDPHNEHDFKSKTMGQKTRMFRLKTYKSASTSRLICPHCGELFPQTFNLHHHILTRHLDSYFSSMRKDYVSESQFKLIIDHLIFKEFIKDFNCNLCWKKNVAVNLHFQLLEVKIHLIQNHKEELVEKLMEIQNNLYIMSQVAKCSHACQCGTLFQSRMDLMRHSTKCKVHLTVWGRPVPCPDCGKKVPLKFMKRHKESYCEMRTTETMCAKCGEVLAFVVLREHEESCLL